jgi:hypothetical protein
LSKKPPFTSRGIGHLLRANTPFRIRPAQTLQGNPEQPITIQFQWSSTPEWLPSVTVNQQVNHITTSTDRAEEIRQLIDGQARRSK